MKNTFLTCIENAHIKSVKIAQGEKEQELARKRLDNVRDAVYHFPRVLNQLYRDFYERGFDM